VVGGTKTLHHLLPDLVPPMDRRWTGAFSAGGQSTRRLARPPSSTRRPVLRRDRAGGQAIATRRCGLADVSHEASRQRRRGLLLHQRHQAEGLTCASAPSTRRARVRQECLLNRRVEGFWRVLGRRSCEGRPRPRTCGSRSANSPPWSKA
jgi:hypothetical protein